MHFNNYIKSHNGHIMALDYIYGYVVAVWSSSFFTALLFGWYQKTVVKTKLGFFFFFSCFCFLMLFFCFSFFFFFSIFLFFVQKLAPPPAHPRQGVWGPNSLVPSRPWRFRMWRHLSSLSGKFALSHSVPSFLLDSATWPGYEAGLAFVSAHTSAFRMCM